MLHGNGWSRPARATARVLTTVTATKLCSLSWRPSFTTSRRTKRPRWSGMKYGVAVVASVSTALLPGGRPVKLQRYVRTSPSESRDCRPSSVTRCNDVVENGSPASAMGAVPGST